MSSVSAIEAQQDTDFDEACVKAEEDSGMQEASFYLEGDSSEEEVFLEDGFEGEEDKSTYKVDVSDVSKFVETELNNPYEVPTSKIIGKDPQLLPNSIKQCLTSRLSRLLSSVDLTDKLQSKSSSELIENITCQKQSAVNSEDELMGLNNQNGAAFPEDSLKWNLKNSYKRKHEKSIDSTTDSQKMSRYFRCAKCGEAFRIRLELENHLFNHHALDLKKQKSLPPISDSLIDCTSSQPVSLKRKDNIPLSCNVTCNECSTVFYDVNRLLIHLSTFSLSSCRQQSKQPAESAKHVTSKTSTPIEATSNDGDSSNENDPNIPDEIDLESSIEKSLSKSEEKAVDIVPNTSKISPNFRCTDCNASFRILGELQNHILSHHALNSKRRANISTVGESYFDFMLGMSPEREDDIALPEKSSASKEGSMFSEKIRKHMQTEEKEKRHVCPHCPSKFYRRSVLRVHLRSHTGEKPYMCSFCSASFGQQSGLTNHLRTHTGVKPFSCTQCSASFTQNCNLLAHLRLHTGEKPFKCDKCPAEFIRKQALQTHSWKHGGEKPLKCKYCPARFSLNSALRNHTRKHTGEKPFMCSDCSASFANKRNLQVHIRTHTGEKPYSCTYCDAKFSLPLSYKIHLRTHTGEKPYLCDYCGAKSNNLSNMRKHVRTHTGDKPFLCSHCGARFNQKSSLELHLKAKKHSQEN